MNGDPLTFDSPVQQRGFELQTQTAPVDYWKISADAVRRHYDLMSFGEIEKSSASPVELLQKHVYQYDENALSRLLLEISLLESAYRSGGDADNDVLLTTARRYRIDAEKLQRAVAQEFAAKQKKKEKKVAPDKSAA
jgi:hypothetical protein